MPGICGIIGPEASHDLASSLDAMIARMRHENWYVESRHVDVAAGVGIARVSLGYVNRGPQPAIASEPRAAAVMDGELYNVDACRRALAPHAVLHDNASQAELLLRGYLALGNGFLKLVEGKFIAAIWNESRRRLTLINDRFGLKTLYTATTGQRFLFASEIKSLFVDGDVSRAASPRGLAQFVSFGHLWSNDTLYDGIQALPAASAATWDARSRRLDVDRYWTIVPPASASRAPAAIDRVDAALKRSVERQAACDGAIGVSLSGGLDSRTVLGLVDAPRDRLTAVSIGIPGSLDHRCAKTMAEMAGCRYEAYDLDDAFLADFESHLRRVVHLTDGHFVSQCIVMPTLPFYRQLGVEVLLRGHAGELMHMCKSYNYSLDERSLAIADDAELEAWLLARLSGFFLNGVAGPLFAGLSTADVSALARDTVRDALDETRSWSPQVHRIWHVFINQRLRRETSLSLAKFGWLLETRVPFLDGELIDALMALPPDMKLGDELQTEILRRHMPQFLRVVNANIGAPLGAGPLRRRLAYYKLRVLSKLRVRGYEPYERLGLWLREQLRPLVTETLLGDRCLERGLFVPDTVRDVVSAHFDGRRNHTYLVMAMMILELGRRMLVDGEMSPALEETAVTRT